jgi:hypothetical protein
VELGGIKLKLGGDKNKPKVSMLELLRLCRKYGVDAAGVKIISKELGISPRTINRKINEYCIIPNLHGGL